VRRERGRLTTSWLDARFSFSFGAYVDPAWPGFGPLAALNEDIVQPGTGFAMHPHSDLDIFMIPWRGTIAHEDSLGNACRVQPGQVLMMRAGSGIRHSQMNPSASELDHHFQVWLSAPAPGMQPVVSLRSFAPAPTGVWRHIATRTGEDGSFELSQEASLAIGSASGGTPLHLTLDAASSAYVHVLEGACTAAMGATSERLAAGDALVVYESPQPVAFLADAGEARLLLVLVPSSRVLRNRTRAEMRAGR